MSTEENKAILRSAYEDLWGKGDLTVADRLIAPDCADHHSLPGQASGREGFKQAVTMVRAAFPDMQITTEDVIPEGDKVVGRWTARATHQGEFMGIPPTSRSVTITGIDVLRIADGEIVDWWHEEDILGLMQQIGAIPEPGQPAG